MAIRKIRVNDDPILRKKSREVTEFDERLFTLLDDMRETQSPTESDLRLFRSESSDARSSWISATE